MPLNRQTISWALFDFADTAFSALFITFFFPLLIKVHLGGTEFQIGLAFGLSVALAALLVPAIGAYSDITGKRLPILIGAALATAVITVLTGYAGLMTALALGFLARLANLVSKDIYDAKMTDLVPRAHYGALSGFGVAVGYLGTIASLAVAYPVLSYFGWENIEGVRAVFWQTAIFYIVFSLPLFVYLRDVPRENGNRFFEIARQSFARVAHTVRNISQFPRFARFLAASFFYNNGMNTVIIFLALYGREVIGLSIQKLFPAVALMAVFAAIGSFVVGRMADGRGPVQLIRSVLMLWVLVVLLLIAAPSYATFLLGGSIGGGLLGAIWTLNRQMVGIVAPPEKMAELFGFEGLTEKFSGVLGPIVFGYLASFEELTEKLSDMLDSFAFGQLVTLHSYTVALFSVLVFIGIGLFLMRKMRLDS